MANVWKDPNIVIKDAIAKTNAWIEFAAHFPKADRSRFVAQGSTDGKNVTEEIFSKEGPGFPYQLAPLGSKVSLPIPAVPFDGKAQSLKKNIRRPNPNIRHA